jgi:hypothetical protein
MEFYDVVDSKKRNYAVEKEILLTFSEILKSCISFNSIKTVLEQNGFNGVYTLDNDLFSKLSENSNIMGIYDIDTKAIFLNEKEYYNNKKIGIHEMGHAYLSGKIKKELSLNGEKIKYGLGIEEGAVSLLMSTNNIEDISKCDPEVYFPQSKLFQELNVLYGYSNIKQYSNLLINMFIEPENFMALIKDIYSSIYKSNYSDFDLSLAQISTFDLMRCADILTDIGFSNLIFYLSQVLNSVYLSIADKDIREEVKKNKLFIFPNKYLKKDIENEIDYMKRQEYNLKYLLKLIQDSFDEIDENKAKTNMFMYI